MSCPNVKIQGRKLILVSGYRDGLQTTSDKRVSTSLKIDAIKKLRQSANQHPNAVAFGYVAGRWIPAA